MTTGSVGEVLVRARMRGLDALDAQVLLAHCLGCPRAWLLAHKEAALTELQQETFAAHVLRRSHGEPLAYLTGAKDFHGLMLSIDARVLVPRPETEHLVDWGLELLAARPDRERAPRVIDLGTGSGALALAIKNACPLAMVHASDASALALQVAAANATRLGLELVLVCSDWWQAVAGPAFDLVLCNPPYVAADEPGLGALRHEPSMALTPGPVGLEAIEHLVPSALPHLQPGGWLLLEHGFEQAEAVRQIMLNAGLGEVSTRRDLAGHERCTGGRWQTG